jgi:hypothetical protein
MAESQINNIILCFIFLIVFINIVIYKGEIQNAILPKFISASYKDNLTLEFNSMMLKKIFKYMSKPLKLTPSKTSFLIGDIPAYANKRDKIDFEFKRSNKQEQQIIENIKKDKNYISKIPINNNTKYFIFPNFDKTKVNIVLFSLEKLNNTNYKNEIIFPKLSQISLYEIPIDNFIINYQSEFNLSNAFFKFRWKILLPGIIIKHSFSSDYEQLSIVYKNITNFNQIRYNIVYINIYNNDDNENNLYDIIELDGNLKIDAIAVTKDIIIYSRKYDLYKLNFLIKDNNCSRNKWINLPKYKINVLNEPYHKISDLKFIFKNKNKTKGQIDDNDKDIFLFVKGIFCNTTDIYLYMKFMNIDLNYLDYDKFNIDKIGEKNVKNNIIYLKESEYEHDSKIVKESVLFYNQSISSFLHDPNIFSTINYDMENLELDKLNEHFKNFYTSTVFNKYLLKNGEPNFFEFHFLIGFFPSYSFFSLNSSFFYEIKSNNYSINNILKNIDYTQMLKMCNKEGNYFIQYNDNSLIFRALENPISKKEGTDLVKLLDMRRISFLSLPKCFKPKIIHDYYFDKFDNKYILIILIDDGVLLSLDFSKSIENKNNAAVFYMDYLTDKKLMMLTINFLFLFFYFLDWPHLDQISVKLRDIIVDILNNSENENINNNNNMNRLDYGLNLSNSNLSITSSEDNGSINNNTNGNVEENGHQRRERRERVYQTSILEDILEIFPL